MSEENAPSRKTIMIKGGALENGILISRKESRSTTLKKLKMPKTSPDSKKMSQSILDEIRKKYLDNLKNKEEEEPLREPRSSVESSKQQDIKEMLDSDVPQDKDFIRSMDFLEKLSQTSLKPAASSASAVPVALASSGAHHPPHPHQPHHPHNHSMNVHSGMVHRQIQPVFGCIKRGGLLPTYRTFNMTQKNLQYPYPPAAANSMQPMVLSSSQNSFTPQAANPTTASLTMPYSSTAQEKRITELSSQQQLLEKVKEVAAPPPPASLQQYQRVTKRRTHRVGKSRRRPVISVLLPNRTIRSKIKTHHKTLKSMPIHAVKQSLVKSGLIKIGCDAPENVLREIYENVCLIGGPVTNYNPDILYYNMLNDQES